MGALRLGGNQSTAVLATIDDMQELTAMARVLRWASPAGKRQPKPDAVVLQVREAGDLERVRRVQQRLAKWPQAQLALIAAGDDALLLMDAVPLVDAVLLTDVEGAVLPLAVVARDAGKPLVLQGRVADGPGLTLAVDALLEAARLAREEEATVVLSLNTGEAERIPAYRLLAARAAEQNLSVPIVLSAPATLDPLLPESMTLGSLLCDGIGDAVVIGGMLDSSPLAFNILQAAGTRLTKTDYVACPSCGRTLFDLQETTERIKTKTSHLVGVRLAIMGCIVNGPGEMADADFGYVGGAPGQVNLYVGKECVERGVPAEVADERLVDLIKAHGKWQEEDGE